MKNILLIEDDIEIVNLISTYIKTSAYSLTHIDNGEDGLSLILEDFEKFDVVLVDRVLPGLDGIEIIKNVKNSKQNIKVPIVMITSSSKDEQVSQGIAAGAFYYLIKPLRKKSFLTVMKQAVNYISSERSGQKYYDTFLKGNSFITNIKATVNNHRDIFDLAYSLSFNFRDPNKAFRGIVELLSNAVEFGIYCVGEEKGKYSSKADYLEFLDQKLKKLTKKKSISILISKGSEFTEIEVKDPGNGFDWSNFLTLDPANSNKLSGKGIAYAKQVCFDELIYNDKGNIVIARMTNELTA